MIPQETKSNNESMMQIAQKIWRQCKVEIVEEKGESSGLTLPLGPKLIHTDILSTTPKRISQPNLVLYVLESGGI